MHNALKTGLLILIAVIAVAAIAIQFVPVERSNPAAPAPLVADPAVVEVLRVSCYDCHSNETVWPWYAYVAPVSWLVANDVEEARENLNFSAWENLAAAKQAHAAAEMLEEIEEGGMPLPNYLRMHPGARLAAEELAVLEGWADSLGAAENEHGGEFEHEDRSGEDEGAESEDHDGQRERNGD